MFIPFLYRTTRTNLINQNTYMQRNIMLTRWLTRTLAAAVAFSAIGTFAQTITVVEYRNKTLDAYFITGRASEQAALDAVPDFERTGMTFVATPTTAATSAQVKICRFYVSLTQPYTSSHFYGREVVDCEPIQAMNPAGFTWEGYDFAVAKPEAGCAFPIYRGFRAAANGKTPNHRYSVGTANYNAAAAAGYAGEDVQFCAVSATPVSTVAPPSSGAGDCSTYHFSTSRITYQSTSSVGPASSFVRSYNTTPTTFNGQAALQIIDTTGTDTSATMVKDNGTTWSELGTRSTSATGIQESYFAPPITYPKSMTVGQRIDFTRSVQFNPATSIGNGTQSGNITYVSRESIAVPAGTYNACKFTTVSSTQYPTVGSNSTTNTTSWVVPALGLVRAEISDSSTVAGFTVNTSSTVVATAVQ